MYVAREYKLTVMTSSAKLDFYLIILRCITVLGFLFEMLRLVFDLVLGSFFVGNAFYCKSLIIVLLKLRLYLGFLDIAYRLGVPVATDSQKFHEIRLDDRLVRIVDLCSVDLRLWNWKGVGEAMNFVAILQGGLNFIVEVSLWAYYHQLGTRICYDLVHLFLP